MKVSSKVLILILALCLTLGLVSAVYASVPDAGGHWAQAEIEKWVGQGLATGYPDGTFKPDNNVTRAEFVALLNRSLGQKDPGAACSFADVKASDWYYADVATAAKAGYVSGYEDNTFKPDQIISRVEAGVIVSRVLKLPAGNQDAINKFSDAGAIGDWARGSISAMVEKKLLIGYPDGSFNPNAPMTRAESVVMLDRAQTSQGNNVPTTSVPVTGLKLDSSTLSIYVGNYAQLTATVEPDNATNKAVTWQSSDASIVTVDNSGKVYAVAVGNATITATSGDGNKTAACEAIVTRQSSGGGGGGSTPVDSITVTLGNSATGIGKMAAVTLTGYTGATSYRLLKADGTPLTGKIDVGTTVTVLFLNSGDTCQVEVYNTAGAILGTKTVTAVSSAAPGGNVTVTLGNSATGIGKVATVTLTGYTGAASYRLLKVDGTLLTEKIDAGKTVTVLFLNSGDTCKVEVYNVAGALVDTKTVTAS
ncbi:MAG: S-layer homology domain-containing protein [Desulfotomaculaceae bacterium]